MSDIVQKAIELLEDWDTCYSYNVEIRDTAIAALKSQSTEIEKLRRDVKTAVMGDSAELADVKRENERLCKENERLEDTRIEFIGMINKLIDERVKMRKALNPFAYYASQIPEDVSNTASASGTVGDLRAAAAAIRDTE